VRVAVHAMAASCDEDNREFVEQWAAILRLAEQTWRDAARHAEPEGLPRASGDARVTRTQPGKARVRRRVQTDNRSVLRQLGAEGL
jgi:hypothetical protein